MMTRGTDRRTAMMGAGAAVLAAGAARGAPSPAGGDFPPPAEWLAFRPDGEGVVRFDVDVAVIGNSDAINSAGRIGPRDSQDYFNIDVRGDIFLVEGALYPGGTIPEPSVPTPRRGGAPSVHYEINWDFTRRPPAGHWLSRGWAIINGNAEPARDTRGTIVDTRRTEPHLLTEHNYVFSRFAPDLLTPEMLVSNGMDDGDDPDREVMVRAITGGTGRFRFVRGQVTVRRWGRNTTVLRSFSQFPDAHAPNYRCSFELKL